MFSDFEAVSAAHINFELSLSGSDNCCVTLSSASAAATEKNPVSLVSFLLLPEQLPLVFFYVLHFCSVSLYSTCTSHLSESNLATNFYKRCTFWG